MKHKTLLYFVFNILTHSLITTTVSEGMATTIFHRFYYNITLILMMTGLNYSGILKHDANK